MEFFEQLLGPAWPPVWALVKIVVIMAPLMLAVAYLTFAERKVIGYMQVRIGPNRVGPKGWLQPIADALKLLTKEIIVPSEASKGLFVLAPVLTIMPALAAWAVVPFDAGVVLADVNAGLLYVMAITSMGVYGIVIAGWASNSKYAFIGSLRSAAQVVSYELAMGFALVCVLMVAQSLNLSDIVKVAAGRRLLELELRSALPDVPRLPDLRRRRDQPRAVRRVGRRERDRGGLPRRVFGHGVRHLLPRRIREHDPGGRADQRHVPRRLAAAARHLAAQRDPRHLLAARRRSPSCCFSSSGSAPRSRATATTRSCASAGRCSFP